MFYRIAITGTWKPSIEVSAAPRYGFRCGRQSLFGSFVVGRKGVVRFNPIATVEHFLSGPGIVGMAFFPSRAMIVATTNAIYRVDVGVRGYRF